MITTGIFHATRVSASITSYIVRVTLDGRDLHCAVESKRDGAIQFDYQGEFWAASKSTEGGWQHGAVTLSPEDFEACYDAAMDAVSTIETKFDVAIRQILDDAARAEASRN